MAYQSPRLSAVKDNLVRIFHPDPIEPVTYLTDTVSAGGTALTVKNNAGFSNGDLLLLDSYGAKGAEIKKVNGAVTAGSSLTSTAATFAHGISTRVSRAIFNQVEISGSATPSGSKTVIATVDINVSGPYTDYVVASTTYAYYFARFYNSLAASPYYGEYSDAVAASDFDPKNVAFIRRLAFGNMAQEYAGLYVNDVNWFYDQVYLCELDVLKGRPHSSELTAFDYDLGNVTTGMRSIALPADIEDKATNKSIIGLRIGTQQNMQYIDRPEFEWRMQNVAVSTCSLVSVSDTTVTLADSRDFADSGSVNIGGTSYPYTANNRSTGVLSGFTAFAATVAAGTDVWQNATFGEPRYYTVSDGTAYFDVPPSSDWNGRNIWLDYQRGASRPDSDGDSVLFSSYPSLYIAYVQMAIKMKKNNGEIAVTDPLFINYEREKAQFLSRDRNPIGVRLIPDIPLTSRGRLFDHFRR